MTFRRIVAGLACLAFAGPAWSQPGAKDGFVLTDTQAVGLLPPALVAAPMVTSAQWSPDGRYVIALRRDMRLTPAMVTDLISMNPGMPAPGDVTITVWDSRSHEGREVWKLPAAEVEIQRVTWIPGTGIALAIISIREPGRNPGDPPGWHRHILRVSAETQTARDIAEPPGYFELAVSPSQPIAVVTTIVISQTVPPSGDRPADAVRRMHVTLTAIRASGAEAGSVQLPEGLFGASIAWDPEGRPLIRARELPAQKGAPAVERVFAWNTTTGELKPFSGGIPQPATNAQPEGAIRLRAANVAAKEGSVGRNVRLLWLESTAASDQSRALVAANVDTFSLSPNADAVLYVANGAAWVSPLVRLPREVFLKARADALRQVALSNAKQAGVAALMYVEDYDECLPGAGGDIAGELSPYLKGPDLISSLTYTYGGGPLKDIENPAETELGYVAGPGGRAIIYADGHVKWKSD